MKKKILCIIAIALLIATIYPVAGTQYEKGILEEQQNPIDIKNSPTGQEEWWPMFRHDSGNTGCSSSIAPNTNQLSWKETIADNIFSATPVVSDERLYISTNWYYSLFEPPNPPNMIKSSIFKEPCLSEIFEMLTTQNDEYFGGIYCLDSNTGTELWNYPLYAPNDPAVVNDKVYTTDLNIDSYNSYLYCFNAETGNNIWQKPVGGLVLSPTIVADNKIYLGSINLYGYFGTVKCFDLDGDSIWTYPLPSNEIIWFSAPAYYQNKIYFITSDIYSYYTGKLYCLDAETGEYLWSKPIFSFWFIFGSNSPVCSDGKVYAVDFNLYGYSGYLKCFDAVTGDILWTRNIGFSFSTPAVCEDSVFVTAFDLYSYNSWLYRFDTENGNLIWKVPVPGFIYFFTSSSPICSANKVFVSPGDYYSYSNELYCYDREDGSFIWSYELDYETLSAPSIADERVYIADYMGTIYAFEDVLKIWDISGGLMSVKAEIRNIGDYDFSNVSWSISVTGGAFDMIDRTASGTISTLGSGDSKLVRATPIFGLGKIEIIVTATMPGLNVIKKELEGFVLGPLVVVTS